MDFINYHHLLYFWMVAREGSIVGASEKLFLAPSTISSQVRSLEDSLRVELFDRSGRSLKMTDMGRMVFGYADQIFGLGRDLVRAVDRKAADRRHRLAVGIADEVSGQVGVALLQPALKLEDGLRLYCRRGRADELLGELARGTLDLVLVDAPLGPSPPPRAYEHGLGSTPLVLVGSAELVDRYGGAHFPQALSDGVAPLLLPTSRSTARRDVDLWLDQHNLHPQIVGEFEEEGLMISLAELGHGLMPAPKAAAEALEQSNGLRIAGQVDDAQIRYFAITADREPVHPAIVATLEAAAGVLQAAD